eukprot:TRINITY_DN15791_c0_g1_i1.p1 TRINITY_DN15791_c0_g1~~TRINITY_DN15791_c0_g1_i1.p1  ORF type:complete len:385 (+),score=152.86 TRINITY_DN15791_c0_g1_i1:56-1210(+)
MLVRGGVAARRHAHKIALLSGDGIGPEVMESCVAVLDAAGFKAEYFDCPIGWEYWKTEGNALPDRTLEMLTPEKTDAALFAAITSKPAFEAAKELCPELLKTGIKYTSPIVRMRQELNLHTNYRPCKALPGNARNYRDNIDWVIFRQNTEGMYGGVEFHPLPQSVFDALDAAHPKMKKFEQYGLDNIALSTRIMTRQACEAIVRQAFEYADKYNRKSVTVVDKPNVLRETGGLMIQCGRRVAADFPHIPLKETNIDAQCMFMLKQPEAYDVIVAENMFGDILSDLGAEMIGGLGFAPSGNLGDNYAVFEPSHGSAPPIVGTGDANPIAMIRSATLMLQHLGEDDMAATIDAAVATVVREGVHRMKDFGGSTKKDDMTQAIIKLL